MTDVSNERRKSPRFFYKSIAICQKGTDGLEATIPAQLLNLSVSGAQLLVRGEFKYEESFVLVLMTPRRETIAEVGSTVRWLREEGPGVFKIGVQFPEKITEEQVTAANGSPT